jgi:hypothetical protein
MDYAKVKKAIFEKTNSGQVFELYDIFEGEHPSVNALNYFRAYLDALIDVHILAKVETEEDLHWYYRKYFDISKLGVIK